MTGKNPQPGKPAPAAGQPQKKAPLPMGTWIALGVIAIAVVVAIFMSQPRKAPAADPGWAAKQEQALAERKAAGWEEIERGLLWRRVKGDGSGRHPLPSDTVTIHYEGKLVDGTVFDSTQGGKPASFPLGGLIEAWQLALPKAGIGDTIEIAVPPALGYGDRGGGPIPGGAVLLFKIELLSIE
ncbi:FKBP-type peptidyl-prolyl cis-trans isomerase [Sphingomonas canadensis]|uniref:Peptidyl-prolyl cis-trans isomerase n=1 Tax=Sphingomonas canadensis TaxID=1219257 RepID=A0ABW3HD87_9SPHN|nr:FKBP-type peptidyl-prolyl cis-trans isomerase [Sphingomonas canadensis]MCW3837056.1 FKBP-type peptidyl-prolyl cis-trans isomerase [Sphingomonas canadensis]